MLFRSRAESDICRGRAPCRRDRSKMDWIADLCCLYFSSRLLACFLLSVSFPVSRSSSSCSPRHSCIPYHVMIDVFIFQRLYIRICPTIPYAVSYRLIFSLPPPELAVCNRSLLDERGVKKIATSGRIWQDRGYEDLLVSPNILALRSPPG